MKRKTYAIKIIDLDNLYFQTRRLSMDPPASRPSNRSTYPPRTNQTQSTPQTPSTSQSTPQRDADTMDIDRLRRERRCFHCKKVGHISRDCRSKPQQGPTIRTQDIEGYDALKAEVEKLTKERLTDARTSGEQSGFPKAA